MTDHFKTFHTPRTFSIDRRQLERVFHELQKATHPDRFVEASPEERELVLDRSSGVNHAYRVLRDPLARTKHLLALYGHSVESAKRVPQELLMAVMEVQEKIGELEANPAKERKATILAELLPIRQEFDRRVSEIDKQCRVLSMDWDNTAPHVEDSEHLSTSERAVLNELASLLAERAYIETLRRSVEAARTGDSHIIRH